MAKPPERSRLSLIVFLAICGLCLVLPRYFYSVRLAIMEFRYSALVLLLVAGFIWILLKVGPRDKR